MLSNIQTELTVRLYFILVLAWIIKIKGGTCTRGFWFSRLKLRIAFGFHRGAFQTLECRRGGGRGGLLVISVLTIG